MCPIPDFDHNNVLPPFKGKPTSSANISPYDCSIIELCEKFATSPERIEILKGLLSFRKKLTENGVIFGYQWLDGSFMENVEAKLGRPPNDLDIVTLYGNLKRAEQLLLLKNLPEFANPSLAKNVYKLDHQIIDLDAHPFTVVELTRFWIQLFTHNREGVWKGMLKIVLNTPNEDEEALKYLNSI